MARIRSIHPGLWTDEAFVSCSPLARLLLIGLWNEADDQGVFEWKPVSLKMRLLPVDNADVALLLGELVAVNSIREFAADGRTYGALRNFRKFQRPKYPSATHPLPPDLRKYVGLTDPIGEIPIVEPHSFPQTEETAPQMEDGGWRMEEEGVKKEVSADADSSPGGDLPDHVDDDAKAKTSGGSSVREAFDAYNLTAERLGLPIAKTLTTERRKRLKARLTECGGLDGWREALDRIAASPFLTGQTDHAFRADLDFLCQAKSFQRLIEGFYDGRAPPNGNGQRRSGMMDEVRRRLDDDDGHAQGEDQGDRGDVHPRRIPGPAAGGQ